MSTLLERHDPHKFSAIWMFGHLRPKTKSKTGREKRRKLASGRSPIDEGDAPCQAPVHELASGSENERSSVLA